MHLKNAFTEYGQHDFVLVVFEIVRPTSVVTRQQLIEREDRYLEAIVNKYNILLKAYTTLGYRHTPEQIEKIRQLRTGRRRSKQTRQLLSEIYMGEGNGFWGHVHDPKFIRWMSESRKGEKNPMCGKPKSPEFLYYRSGLSGGLNTMAKTTRLTNIHTGEVRVFETFKEARLFLKASPNQMI